MTAPKSGFAALVEVAIPRANGTPAGAVKQAGQGGAAVAPSLQEPLINVPPAFESNVRGGESGSPECARRRLSGSAADNAWNLTITNIERQLIAMDNEYGYDIGVRSEIVEGMSNFHDRGREWVMAEATVGYLRARNGGQDKVRLIAADSVTASTGDEAKPEKNAKKALKGQCHIYIRPNKTMPSRLVLVDDWSAEQLAAVEREGWNPALVVETSLGNHQAWFKLPGEKGDYPTPKLRTNVARFFASEWGADKGSAEISHYGRLAGFSNPKPSRKLPDGKLFFSKVRASTGETVSNSLIEVVESWARDRADAFAEVNSFAAKEIVKLGKPTGGPGRNAARLQGFIKAMIEAGRKAQIARGMKPDGSSADWFAVSQALGLGYSVPDVIDALIVETAHKSDVERYAVATVTKGAKWLQSKRSGVRYEDVKGELLAAAKASFPALFNRNKTAV